MELTEDNKIKIDRFLPHREPMLMVDYILELSSETVTTSFEIKPENIFLQNSLFVEAGLVENCAQTSASIFGQRFFEDPESDTKVIGFITNIKKIEVFGLPKVGDTIISKASLVSKYDNICQIRCETFLNGNCLIHTDLSLFIQEVKS